MDVGAARTTHLQARRRFFMDSKYCTSLRLSACAAATAMLGLATLSHGQSAPIPKMVLDFDRPSGLIENKVVAGGPELDPGKPRLIYSTVVSVEGSPWMRLYFGDVMLSGSLRTGNASYLAITSLEDKAVQYLNALTMDQWGYSTAYFNGDAVLVELFAYPDTGDNRVDIDSLTVGLPANPLPEDQCGATDDRVQSFDDRMGRIMDIGCTGYLIQPAGNCFLTAGHCTVASFDVVQFNVPLSDPDGSTNNPGPEDQYAIDPASVQFTNGGPGNDWCFFGAFNNANTGLSPGVAQGTAF